MAQDGDALVAGQIHLLAVPLFNARITVRFQGFGVWHVHAPMSRADGIAHALGHQLLLCLAQLNGVGGRLHGRDIAFARAGFGDMIKLRLFDGRQLYALDHERTNFLKLAYDFN